VPRATAGALPVGALLLLGACAFGEITVARPAPQVVVHAVLNAGAEEQVILVESSLTGRVTIDSTSRFDPRDPIRTGGGEPITGADVRLLPDGDTTGVRAVETQVGTLGTGRYVVAQTRLDVRPGARYRLRVRTTDGRAVSGETRVPGATADWTADAAFAPRPQLFDRDRDTVRLSWSPVAPGRTYAVRVETPYGPWALFTDSTTFTITGALRNFFAGGLPYVFSPGFRQTLIVAAVDANFYDYNRSGNDPFGGTGLISSVQGGLGLFGSMVVLERREVSVTRQDRAPLDARWSGVTGAGTTVDLDLWIDAPGPTASSVSGRQRSPERFVVGTLVRDTVRLVTLAGTSSADTVAYFIGRLSGDSIVGRYDTRFASTGPVRWQRRPRVP
jgi:hypothetical protein